MAKSAQERLYDQLSDKYGPKVADAFLEAIRDLTDKADIDRLIAALAAGRIDDAMLALHIDEAAFAALEEALRNAVMASGQGYTALINAEAARSGLAAVFRFSGRATGAEELLRTTGADLVTRITREQTDLLRSALVQGLAQGRHPTTTALDVVGRVDRVTGVREGGIVGLTREQAGWLTNAREELRSGDPARLANYLTRTTRDKGAFGSIDKAVRRAMVTGEPVPEEVITRAMKGMGNRLLKLRGDMIGRTETLRSLNAASLEAYRQAAEAGGFLDSEVDRFWRDASDLRVRHSHAIMDGQRANGLTLPFRSPTGARMMYPGDTSLGAKAEDVVLCRCWAEIRLGYVARQLRLEAAGA